MRRRYFITLLAGAALWPLPARAQVRSKIPHLGWLATGSPATYRFSLAAFRGGLSALKYIEGQNVTIEYRWAEGNISKLPALAKELVQRNVDVILAGGTAGAQAAKDATQTIPIVAAGAGDLAEVGLVKSLTQPGGNLTGFVALAPETAGKRAEIIKQILGQVQRAAVLWNPTNPSGQLEAKSLKEAAANFQLSLTFYGASTVKELQVELREISRGAPDALIVLNDPFVFVQRKTIVDFAAQFHTPAIYGFREFVDDGGLVSYGAHIADTYRRAAEYIDKILKGAKPGDLPVELPTKFELVINLEAAKTLGLQIPDRVLAIADDMIE